MAIDSAAKRKSVGGVLGYFTGGPGVTPSATATTAWRQQAGYGYSGVAVSSFTTDRFVTLTIDTQSLTLTVETQSLTLTAEN